MKAQTHPGDEKRVENSSSDKTMETSNQKGETADSEQKANRELEPNGLSVSEIAEQSAYENDQAEVAQKAANSNRHKDG